MKRKAEQELQEEENQRMWNHGDRWLRGKMIGEGCFGSVFLAAPKKPRRGQFSGMPSLPAVMAVKSAEACASESIQHEAEVLLQIKGCPFIIERLGEEFATTDEGDMVYNLLLEYASGGTLHDLIQRSNGHGLPESDVRRYTRSILEGIKHIHKHDYVHCDLKPENILLVPDHTSTSSGGTSFVTQIAGFGLAKRTKEKYNECRGTPLYLPPEALIANQQDQSSDIWSLGCVVLEMLTGKAPWDLKGVNLSLEDYMDVMIFSYGSCTPKIPAHLSSVVRGFLKICLSMKPWERLTAETLLLHPFVAQPQPSKAGPIKLKVVNSALGHNYKAMVCSFKENADYQASSAFVPRVHPPPSFGIPAGL